MTESSSPNSVQLARAVDPLTCRVLRLIDHAVAATGSRYFVAGGAARDLMLVNVLGRWPGRATRDIDFGVAVKSWDEFQELKDRLVASNEFETAQANAHRLFLKASGDATGTAIDMIPFGGVESET